MLVGEVVPRAGTDGGGLDGAEVVARGDVVGGGGAGDGVAGDDVAAGEERDAGNCWVDDGIGVDGVE